MTTIEISFLNKITTIDMKLLLSKTLKSQNVVGKEILVLKNYSGKQSIESLPSLK